MRNETQAQGQAPASEPLSDERAAFERAWHDYSGMGPTDTTACDFAWMFWQKRAALRARPTSEPCPKCSGSGMRNLVDDCEPCGGSGRARPTAGVTRTGEQALADHGVFKGAHGLRGLLNAREFWDSKPYGTRLYYGDGAADYLHIGVLAAAVEALDALPAPAAPAPTPTISLQVQYQRRRWWAHHWQPWEACSEADAKRIQGLRSWEWRRVDVPVAAPAPTKE